MLSYHNDAHLKSLVVAEMKRHQEADQFIKGTYSAHMSDKFKGCAVGCTIDSLNLVLGKSFDTSEHMVLEEAIGIPVWLAHLQDLFFERLPTGESSQFAVDFLSAIPVGVNLEPVKHKFLAFILRECMETVTPLQKLPPELKEQVLNAIKIVLVIHENAIATGKWDEEMAKKAGEVAWEASEAAATEEEWTKVRIAAWTAWEAREAREAWEAAWAPAEEEWTKVRIAAWTAWEAVRPAEWAAWTPVRPAAWAPVRIAAAEAVRPEEAGRPSARAVWAAVRTVAWEPAWAPVRPPEQEPYKRYSNELIRLLVETKQPKGATNVKLP